MSQAERILSPEGRVNFPNLFEARRNDLSGKDEFSVVLIFDKNADLSALKAAVMAAIEKKWGVNKPSGLRSPFRSGSVDREGKPEYEDKVFISAKSKYQPSVVDYNVKEIIDPKEIYSGCYGRASLTCYAYDMMGNKGVSFGLRNFQKTRDGEPIAGSRVNAEDEFEPVANADTATATLDEDLFAI